VDVFEEMKMLGVWPDNSTYLSLLQAAMRSNDMHRAEHFFRQMRTSGHTPGPLAYNLMINTSAKVGNAQIAFQYSDMMEHAGVQMDIRTFQSLLRACAHTGDVARVEELVAKMEEAGLRHNPLTAACLIQCYGNKKPMEPEILQECQSIMEASRRFSVNKKVPLVVYEAMMQACIRFGHYEAANKMYKELPEVSDGTYADSNLHLMVMMNLHQGKIGVAMDLVQEIKTQQLHSILPDTYKELLGRTVSGMCPSRIDSGALVLDMLEQDKYRLDSEQVSKLMVQACHRSAPSLKLAHKLWDHIICCSIVSEIRAVQNYLLALMERCPELPQRRKNVRDVLDIFREIHRIENQSKPKQENRHSGGSGNLPDQERRTRSTKPISQ